MTDTTITSADPTAATAPVPTETLPISATGAAPAEQKEISDAEHFGFNEREAKRWEKEWDELVVELVSLVGGHLKAYRRAGDMALSRMRFARNNLDERVRKANPSVTKTAFTDGDFDGLCERYAEDVRRRCGVNPKQVKVDNYVRVAVFCEQVEKLGIPRETLERLPYSLIANYIQPAALSFSKSNLTGEIRAQWADFVKTWIPRAVELIDTGEKDVRGHVESAIKALKQQIADEKNGKKSAEELARIEAQKRINADAAHKKGVESRLVKVLTDAFDGTLKPEEFMSTVEHVAKEMGVELPQAFGFDPMNATTNDALMLVRLMFKAGKFATLKALATEASKLVAALEAAGISEAA